MPKDRAGWREEFLVSGRRLRVAVVRKQADQHVGIESDHAADDHVSAMTSFISSIVSGFRSGWMNHPTMSWIVFTSSSNARSWPILSSTGWADWVAGIAGDWWLANVDSMAMLLSCAARYCAANDSLPATPQH